MPVPKQHHSRLRQKRGRIRFEMDPKNTQKCPQCGSPVLAHRACAKCGTYRGRTVAARPAKKSAKK